jgi:hypothetical protein
MRILAGKYLAITISIELQIPRFCEVKRINLLEAFPLQYHSDPSKVKVDLLQSGQKFVFLIGLPPASILSCGLFH